MKFLTISETAKYLGVHPQTLRNWIRDKRITAYRPNPRGKIFLRFIDINKMLKSSEGDSLAQPTPLDIIQNEATSGAYDESIKTGG